MKHVLLALMSVMSLDVFAQSLDPYSLVRAARGNPRVSQSATYNSNTETRYILDVLLLAKNSEGCRRDLETIQLHKVAGYNLKSMSFSAYHSRITDLVGIVVNTVLEGPSGDQRAAAISCELPNYF